MKYKLYGAILGDLAGQPHEFPIMKSFPENANLHNPISTVTDDTLMTLATAKSIIDNQNIEEAYKEVGNKYVGDYYGKGFKKWLKTEKGTKGFSWGNGCLMRVSPYFYLDLTHDEKLIKVLESCLTSHVSSISAASCMKLSELYVSSGLRKVCKSHDKTFQKFKKFEVRADRTIEFCENIFWSHTSTHEALKNVISCGGDTDTNASIIGELMNYTYQDLTKEDIEYVESKLDPYLLNILKTFNEKY